MPADTSSSYLPVHFKHLRATVFDLDTLKVVATGDLADAKVARGDQVAVVLPVTFAYTAFNTSDTTCELDSHCISAGVPGHR